MHDTTAFPSTDVFDGITGDCVLITGDCVLFTGTVCCSQELCMPMINSAFQHTWRDQCLASRASRCNIIQVALVHANLQIQIAHDQRARFVPLTFCTWADLVFGCRTSSCMK